MNSNFKVISTIKRKIWKKEKYELRSEMKEKGSIYLNHRNKYMYYTHQETGIIKMNFNVQLYTVYRDMAKN